jgi:hypothetical protein
MSEAAWLLSGMEAEPRTPESLRLLELGTQRGEALERVARECWPDAEVQVTVKVPTPWGEMPGTVDLWIPSLRTIVDFKTAGAYSMGLVVSGEKQDEGYALQLNAYRHGIIRSIISTAQSAMLIGPQDVRTVLVYEAKVSDARKGVTAGMLHEVEVPYTVELEDRYQARLAEIHKLLLAQGAGSLRPDDAVGVYGTKQEWRCKLSMAGKPLYCSIGPVRGRCNGNPI